MNTKRPALVISFAVMIDILPKGRLSRWEAVRHLFDYHPPTNFAAQAARWEIADHGERTRDRWITEYRHQRTLRAIERGTDYQPDPDEFAEAQLLACQ